MFPRDRICSSVGYLFPFENHVSHLMIFTSVATSPLYNGTAFHLRTSVRSGLPAHSMIGGVGFTLRQPHDLTEDDVMLFTVKGARILSLVRTRAPKSNCKMLIALLQEVHLIRGAACL